MLGLAAPHLRNAHYVSLARGHGSDQDIELDGSGFW